MLPYGWGKNRVGINTAARLLLLHWKSPYAQVPKDWMTLMTENAAYECILARYHGSGEKNFFRQSV